MSSLLQYSMFYDVLFPSDKTDSEGATRQDLMLSRVVRFFSRQILMYSKQDIVVFDFETTGLDAREDRIIELGAIKYRDGEAIADFSSLVNPGISLPSHITSITGIRDDMLIGQPDVSEVIAKFLQFIEGSILVAHNAEFDMGFLTANCRRLGYEINWPCFCTLKLARTLLPQLESKNLDSLATHYGLSFEARHRSVGDAKVTGAVLQQLLANEGSALRMWRDLQPIAGIKDA